MSWLTRILRSNDPANPVVIHESVFQQDRYRTTRTITYALLFTFTLSLVALFVVSTSLLGRTGRPNDPETYAGWFELLKTSLVLLGTTLTTIIGYYFGQRDSTAAHQKADEAVTKAKQEEGKAVDLDERLKKAEESVERLTEDLAATTKSSTTAPPAATFDPAMAQQPKPRTR